MIENKYRLGNDHLDAIMKVTGSPMWNLLGLYKEFIENPNIQTLYKFFEFITDPDLQFISDDEIEQIEDVYRFEIREHKDIEYNLENIIKSIGIYLLKIRFGFNKHKKSGYNNATHLLANVLIAVQIFKNPSFIDFLLKDAGSIDL